MEESNDGSSSHPESSSQSLEVADRHERWTKVEIPAVPADELSDDEFLERFGSATLPDWSHKTHLRIAFLFLIRYGRQKGKNRIFDGIRNFIEHSDLARGKTFHLTLTYFWIQMMHLAVASDPLVNRTMEENVERLSFFAFSLLLLGSLEEWKGRVMLRFPGSLTGAEGSEKEG